MDFNDHRTQDDYAFSPFKMWQSPFCQNVICTLGEEKNENPSLEFQKIATKNNRAYG